MKMNIIVRNQAQLGRKYIRLIKWRLYRLKEKFDDLLYAEVFLSVEGNAPRIYQTNIRLGVPGHDIIIKDKSSELGLLLNQTVRSAQRSLARRKSQLLK